MQTKLSKAVEIYNKSEVPTIPDEIIKLQEELHKKYPNTVMIANLISHNPELLGDFLTLVNTNITSEKIEIKDAKAAVNTLGLDEIYNIFLSSALTNMIAQSWSEKMILQNGARVGIACAELSYWVIDVTRSEAYMAGLMQNVGAVYFARAENADSDENNEYLGLYKSQLSNPISAYDAELEKYETSHAFLGVYMAKKWNISADVYKSILLHHDTEFVNKAGNDQKVRHLTALIMVANFIVSSAADEQYITQELKEYRNLGLKQLELPENALKAAFSAVSKWGKAAGLTAGSH